MIANKGSPLPGLPGKEKNKGKMSRRKKHISKDQIEAWRSEGYTLEEMAEAAGVSRETLIKSIRSYGIKIRQPLTPEEKEEVCRLASEGMSMAKIAKRIKRSVSAVNDILKAAGMKEDKRDQEGESSVFTLFPVRYAPVRKPTAKRVLINGKSMWDVTEFYIPF